MKSESRNPICEYVIAVTIISVYEPQSERNEEEKEKSYGNLTAQVLLRKKKYLSWEISVVMLEALPMDIMEFMVALNGEKATGIMKEWAVLTWWLATRFSKRMLKNESLTSIGIVGLWLTMS